MDHLSVLDGDFVTGYLPEIGSGDDRGVSREHYLLGHEKVADLMVQRRLIFKIIQRNGSGNDGNIIEVVTDVEEAKQALDRYAKKIKKELCGE